MAIIMGGVFGGVFAYLGYAVAGIEGSVVAVGAFVFGEVFGALITL